jgi:hypothetical protein
MREDAKLGLTAEQRQGIIGELDHHLTKRRVHPFCTHYLQVRPRGFEGTSWMQLGCLGMRLEYGVGT